MQFIVSSSALLGRLLSVARVINPKSPMPILENFLLSITGTQLTITASDLETTMTTTLEVESSTGDITLAVQAKLLIDTLREFPEQPLQFDVNPDNLAVLIKTESGTFNFIGLNGDEYPKGIVLEEDHHVIDLQSETLFNGISKAAFATADEDLRPTMTGIFFDIKQDELVFVATDAHKLVRLRNLTVKSGADSSFILPKKPAAALKNILPKVTGDIKISFDTKNIRFDLPDYTLICRQIEGRFPNYSNVIPTNNPFKVIINRLAFMNAVKRVSVFSNQGTGLIKLSLASNQLNLTAQDIDFSTSAQELVPCQYGDDAIEIGFKAPLLIDILNNINSSEVIIQLADSSRAGIILPFENEPGEDLLMLLMPMLIS